MRLGAMDSIDPAALLSFRPVAVEKPLKVDEEPKASALQFCSITFHPIRPVLYAATERVIYGIHLLPSAC